MLKTINDKIQLYQAQVKKDPEAFAKLYDQYVKRIYRFVFFKVSNHEEAEDITSEVFLKAWHYINENKEVNSFSGLLYRIARNCIIDFYRARSAKPEFLNKESEELEIGDGGRWYADVSNKVEAEKILIALKKLKQEYQEVITLRYVDELEISEIAEITGKGGVAVRVTLHRAIKKLKEIITVSP
ncbi:RNA polymerase sigma factor [Patescibacteria group bacterium]|nr:RNA polymerase sigma factor [Patescibacteria group bacterium]